VTAKKKKKKNRASVSLQLFGVRDCNQEICTVAKKTWLCLCACKATWLFGIWLQVWVVSDCKKLKCLIAKSAGLFLWLQKKKKKNWTSVRLQLFGVRDCKPGVIWFFFEFNIVDVLASAQKNKKKCIKHKLLKWACDCLQPHVTCDCIVICLRLQ
jgi:hypothetical protein